MIVIKGKFNYAKVMIDEIDDVTKEQIETFLDSPVFKGVNIAIMPDCHAGKGAVIGFTAPLTDSVIPNVIGVDIGCGVSSYNLGKINIDFQKLDDFIRQNIPSGMNIRENNQFRITQEILDFSLGEIKSSNFFGDIVETCISTNQDTNRVMNSLATLGGGNHFAEVSQDSNENKWLVIHSGSRNFGLKIASYYQNMAKKTMEDFYISDYKDLEFLPMKYGGGKYMHHMKIAQKYAMLNRYFIAKIIIEGSLFSEDSSSTKLINMFTQYPKIFGAIDEIQSVHNFIGEDKIIRKGAISAHKDEPLIIPINMRDGSIIGKGKGNNKYNNSAPHGAGRLMGRRKAKENLSLEEYKKTMQGIWTSCVSESTLDEAPMAYKDINCILDNIKETVEVVDILKPIYNFKAQE
jgi:RNA-splicing ligase RtcB